MRNLKQLTGQLSLNVRRDNGEIQLAVDNLKDLSGAASIFSLAASIIYF